MIAARDANCVEDEILAESARCGISEVEAARRLLQVTKANVEDLEAGLRILESIRERFTLWQNKHIDNL